MLCVVSTQYRSISRKKIRFLFSIHRKFPLDLIDEIQLSWVPWSLRVREGCSETAHLLCFLCGHFHSDLDPAQGAVPVALQLLPLSGGQ